MKFRTLLYIPILFSFSSFAQVVIGGGAKIRIDGGTAVNNVFMVLTPPAANPIVVSGATDGIIMEDEYNRLKYNLGTATIPVTVPYMTTALEQLPLTVTPSVAGIGAGNIMFSSKVAATRSTGFDNALYTPTGVANMSTGVDGSNNSAFSMDRFWIIDANSYTSKPAVTLNFSYLDAEAAANGGNTITEANLGARRYNTSANDWNGFLSTGATLNTSANTLSGVIVASADFYRTWVLDACNIPATYTITGGGAYCSGGTGVLVGLSNSQTGYSYQLQVGGSNIGAPITGTGNAISFGLQTVAGNYTIIATNPAGACTATMTGSATITINSLPTVSLASSTNISCNGGTNGVATLNAASGGTPGYNYNWTPGNPTGDGTTSVTGLTAGTWTCTVTDANSCVTTQTVSITQPAVLTASLSGSTNVSCNAGSNGTASVLVSGGTTSYSYNWTPGNPIGDGTASVTGLTAGTWTCTITDANSCVTTQTVSITQPAVLSASLLSSTNISCNGGSNGAASISVAGGTTAYTYDWTPGNPTGDGTASVTGLAAGAWTCTVTDANSCVTTQTVSITQPSDALTISLISSTNVSCSGGSNGSASVSASGGTTSYTYNWTPGNPSGDGTANVSGLTPGTWTCTVTDANSCVTTQTVSITQPTVLSTSLSSSTNVSCFGGNNGTASISVSGGTAGYSYDWTPGNPTGDGTNSVTGLTAGTWTCTVTDANTCVATRTVSITQPSSALTANPGAQIHVSCFGGNNGVLGVSVSGGTFPYSYDWGGTPTGDGTNTITGLTAGTYGCFIVDSKGCTTSFSSGIIQPSPIVASLFVTPVACNGGSNGQISSSVSGGTPNYSYNWTPGNPTGDGTNVISGLTAGVYTLTVTDSRSCVATATAAVTQPAVLSASLSSSSNVSCFGGSNGSASVSVSGGNGGYTYNWTPGNPSGDGTASVVGLSAGTWTCTITDARSCVTTQTVSITQPSSPLSTSLASSTNLTCNGVNNGAASINAATGGTSGYTYNWTPGNPTGDGTTSVTGLTAGTWTCTITDANFCVTTQTVSITQPAALTASISASQAAICEGNSSTLTASSAGGTGAKTYLWSTSESTLSISVNPSINTTYSVTVTDVNGCVNTASQLVSVIPTNTAGLASSSPTLCVNTVLTDITHITTGATGIGTATGLPAGVLANWLSNTITISGVPTESGTFNYSIPLIGGCGSVNATGTINVTSIYNIVASAGTDGTISPAGTIAICNGGSQIYTITPNMGYSIANVLIDGISNEGAIAYGTYTFSNVTADHTIDVTFAPWGPFYETAAFGIPSGNTYHGVTDDFNGDGRQDIVLRDVSDQGTLYLNNGSNTWSAGTVITSLYNGTATSGDFDGDGDKDLLVGNNNQLLVYSNNGDATFTVKPPITFGGVGAFFSYYKVIDLNNDSKLDLVLGNGNYGASDNNLICLNTSTGSSITFNTIQSWNNVGSGPINYIDMGDYDGDGDLDMVTAPAGGWSTKLYKNDGSLVYTLDQLLPGYGAGARFVDWNHDGKLDVFKFDSYNGYGARICYNDGVGNFSAASILVQPTAANYCELADFNGDGAMDIVVSTYPTPSVYLNNGCSVTQLSPSGLESSDARSGILIADYDGDGKKDILNLGRNPRPSKICTNNITPASPVIYSNITSTTPGTRCGTGTVDLSAVASNGGSVKWYTVASGGTAVFTGTTYTTPSISTTTTYYVEAQLNGCSSYRQSVVATVNEVPTSSVSSQTNVSCFGDTNGSATILASGGTPSYTYSWTPIGGSAASITSIAAGTYTCTITDANSCVKVQTVTITQPSSLPTISISGTNAICIGSSTTLTASGALSYTWNNGAVTAENNVSPDINTSYTVTGTDANGCVNTATISVIVNTLPTVSITGTSVICNGESTTLTASGASTYNWNNGVITSVNNVSPVINTTYTVTGTDANGCINTASQLVTVNAVPIVSITGISTICNGESTTLTASGASSYVWNNGSVTNENTVTPSISTTYTVTGTDINGCINTSSQLVTVNALPTVIANATSNSLCSGNSVTLSGSGASSYSWSGGVSDNVPFTPNTTTTYTLTGTDLNGCVNSITKTITVNSLPTVSIAGLHSICLGASTTLTASGASTYLWNTAETTAAILVTPPASPITTYTVTGTDANGCTNTATFPISAAISSSITLGGTSPICSGSSTTITSFVSPSLGVTYSWSTGETTPSIAVSPASTTTYTLNIVDSHGCTNSKTKTIIVNQLPSILIGGQSFICDGNSTTLTADGAATYSWSTGETTTSITVTPTTNTTYSVIGTDVNGCVNTSAQAVTVNSLPTVTVGASPSTISSGSSSTLTATGASTYTWMPGNLTGSSVVVSPTATTTYTVTGTSVTGCLGQSTSTVIVNTGSSSVPLTEIKPVHCGTTLTSMSTMIIINAVSGATNYEYELTESGTGNVYLYQRGNANNGFAFSLVPQTQYGRTYTIRVRAYVGVWGIFGNSCSVSLGPIPTTEIKPVHCGTTVASKATLIIINSVSGATNYEYELTESGTGNVYLYQRGNGNNGFAFSLVPQTQYGRTYSIRVRAFAGVWGAFGNSCSVSLGSIPTTEINPVHCGTTVALKSSLMIINSVSGATNYEYELTESGTGNVYLYQRGNSNNGFAFSLVPQTQYGRTYSIRVRAFVGTWGAFGNPCSVSMPLLAPRYMDPSIILSNENVITELDQALLNVFPNPSTGNIKLETNRTGTYYIINELGQVVRTIEITDISSTESIEGLAEGMYTVISNQAEGFIRQKIIVTK